MSERYYSLVHVIDTLLGPYAPAILRFAVAFPPNYPTLPPLISFVSDIFHPLVTPLTTYTYSTGSLSSETVSATDDERLPPGGFSLRHGFPHWFRRAEKSAASPTVSSRNVSGSHNGYGQNENDAPQYPAPGVPSSRLSPLPALSPSTSPSTSTPEHADAGTQRVGIVDVLDYMKSAFDEDITMDVLPLEAAGNPGAWNAWRAYRKSVKKASDLSKLDATNDPFTQPSLSDLADKPLLNKAKLPSEWNWDGVWRERVQKGIDASISNSVLFGATGGGEELVR